jgi:hypothetical protein
MEGSQNVDIKPQQNSQLSRGIAGEQKGVEFQSPLKPQMRKTCHQLK